LGLFWVYFGAFGAKKAPSAGRAGHISRAKMGRATNNKNKKLVRRALPMGVFFVLQFCAKMIKTLAKVTKSEQTCQNVIKK